MPRCPNCSKRFPSSTGVVQHLSQLCTSCLLWSTDIIAIANGLDDEGKNDDQTRAIPDASVFEEMDVDPDDDNFTMDDGGFPGGASIIQSIDVADRANIFGLGTTFFDNFFADDHADKCQTNLYYPFASRDNWEVGLFLMCSGLSMSAIDQFLKLQLVSKYMQCLSRLILLYRSQCSPCHSKVQQSSGAEQRYFLRALAGRVVLSKHLSKPNALFGCTGAIPSKFWNPYSRTLYSTIRLISYLIVFGHLLLVLRAFILSG